MSDRGRLGLWSGVGLVVGDMVGVGVLLSAGFMALDLTPAQILVCWIVGGVMAMAGARAYAEVAAMIPRSGGEYRYLHDLLHPVAGYFAGWTSLIVGFSAPIAAAAAIAGPFAQTLHPRIDPRWFGTILIVAATLFHALDLRVSRVAQNVFVAIKAALLIGFIAVGVVAGEKSWPTWEPFGDSDAPLVSLFLGHLVWVTYAYSGWNAAIYAAGEFKRPERDVPRAMVIGCALVAAAYLLVNWVFVANLGPDEIGGTFLPGQKTGNVTLGHLITSKLIGDTGGRVMSVFVVVALVSLVSSMMYIGPRVYAAMARDRFIPRWFDSGEDRPPAWSVVLQGALAMLLFHVHELNELVKTVGSILALSASLTCASLFRVALGKTPHRPPGALALLCATFYIVATLGMLVFTLWSSPATWLWMGVVVAATVIAYVITRAVRSRTS